MELLFSIGTLIVLGLLGLIFGTLNERRHYRSIVEREAKLKHILVFNEKMPPQTTSGLPFHLVHGSVVVSSDYFKNMASNLRSLFGGRLHSYERLLDRARREAVLRMKEHALAHGATLIMNVKFETCNLAQHSANAITSCEVLAYGTAWPIPAEPSGTHAIVRKS